MSTKQNVKSSLFTLILAFIVTGTVAVAAVMNNEKSIERNMTTKEVSKENVVMDTWFFHGSDSPTNVTNANLYESSPSTKNCGPKQTICSINAPEDQQNPGHPDLSYENEDGVSVATLIQQARGTKTENEAVNDFREF